MINRASKTKLILGHPGAIFSSHMGECSTLTINGGYIGLSGTPQKPPRDDLGAIYGLSMAVL